MLVRVCGGALGKPRALPGKHTKKIVLAEIAKNAEEIRGPMTEGRRQIITKMLPPDSERFDYANVRPTLTPL